MADQEVALQIRQPDVASTLASAQNFQTNQINQQLSQTQLQMLNRQNAGQDIQFRNQLMSNAIARGSLDADAWDTQMQNAVDAGAPEAGQWIGRYPGPVKAQYILGAYGGAAPATAGTAATAGTGVAATPTDQLDRMYQNVPPAQMAQSLQKNNMILQALSTVKDQPTYDRAIAWLGQNGIPNAAAIAGPYNPLQVVRLWKDTQQRITYLQSRVASASTGGPNPPVKTDMQVVGGVGYDPYNPGKALTPPETEVVPNSFWPDGSPVLKSKTGGILPQGGTVGPNGVTIAEATSRIGGRENATGNPAAVNPRSTATGNQQFRDSTWLSTVKAARPELAKTLSDAQILALRTDPNFSQEMGEAYAMQNATTLAKAGMPVTTATLALAHQFGPGDAVKILNAAPSTPMERLVSEQVLNANPTLRGRTAGSVTQGIVRSGVGNDPVNTSPSAQIVHPGEYDKPQLVETDDGKGGTARILAQQNKRTGQWATADQNRTPINASNMVILPESMAAGGGGRNASMVTRQLVAARDATTEIKNIVELPLAASTGWFGGAQNAPQHSLFNASKNILAQKVTSQDVQDFNTSMIGMGKALAALESGGMQTNQALIAQFDRLALLEGDTNLTKMRKLATMRQQAENALEANLTSPYMGKEQKEFSKNLINELKAAVPWTPSDVTKLQRSNNPSASLSDFAKGTGLVAPRLVGQTYADAKGVQATYGGKDSAGKDIWTPVK